MRRDIYLIAEPLWGCLVIVRSAQEKSYSSPKLICLMILPPFPGRGGPPFILLPVFTGVPILRMAHFRGPIFAVSGAPFLLPPANSPFRGPANCCQFRAGDADFRRMLSNKHTPDRQGWRIFTIRRLLSTGNAHHRRILGSKNTPHPQG